jgi:hypothetical protein
MVGEKRLELLHLAILDPKSRENECRLDRACQASSEIPPLWRKYPFQLIPEASSLETAGHLRTSMATSTDRQFYSPTPSRPSFSHSTQISRTQQ